MKLNMTDYSDYEKAGKIAKEVREWGKTLFKPGAKLLDIAEAIENKIREKGAEPGFPCCISKNSIAAHYSPFVKDETIVEKGDVIKFDSGVHVNGWVADNAITIEVGTKKYTKLIEASAKALENAIKIVKPGIEVREIGKVIGKTIKSYGFEPIVNLNGHGLAEYVVHDHPTIPNFDNGDTTKLKKGQAIAIEPFATDGIGIIKDGKPCGIYELINPKPVRMPQAREVLKLIQEKYKTMPFSIRWIKTPGAAFILNNLEKEGILKQHTQLPEKSGGMVSQKEHSLIVGHKVFTD